MDEPAHDRLPRTATLILVALLASLAVARPGILAGESAVAYRFLTTFTAVAAVAYLAWRFHGLPAAAAAVVMLLAVDQTIPSDAAFVERGADAALLAITAVGVAAGTRQGRFGKGSWIVLSVVALGLAYFGWLEGGQPTPIDGTAHERGRHICLGVAGASLVVGLIARQARWLDRLRLLVVVALLPAAGIAAAHLIGGRPLPFVGGDWASVIDEWRTAVSSGTWADGSWSWANPYVVLPLVALGVWRCGARGFRELRGGRPPLTGLLPIAAIATTVAVGARPLAVGSLALAAFSALLCAFGVFDLVVALVERVALKPPEA